jgi:choline dehydrogenase
MKAADYVIVGGGSAGCVLAARLSEDADARVLLLEAGGSEADDYRIAMPLAWRDVFQNPKLSWGFVTEPELQADGRTVAAPRGKVLGGSNSVNGMMYSRGAPADYDEWRALGLEGWSYRDVLPYFCRSESNWRGASVYHGDSGPLTVTRHVPDTVIYPRLIARAEALGFRHIDDFHGRDHEGFSAPDFNIHAGRRASTVARYLRPVMSRRNLEVVTRAHTHRVLLERSRAVGVEYSTPSGLRQVRAEREVILAAGAFNSPQLLLLSGIGPARELEAAGVAPVRDLPGVGKNLQDHQSVGVIYNARDPVTFDNELRLDRLALSVLRWRLFGSGPIAGLPVAAQGFVRTRPGLTRPDLQMLVSPVSMLARPWFPGWRRGAGHVYSVACVLLHPASRGEVRLARSEPQAPPRIHLNLLDAESDRTALRGIVRFVRGFFAEQPAADLVRGEAFPGTEVQSDAELDAWIRRFVGTAMHPTSTCAMGVDRHAVVDAALRVHGIERLRVADASVMPTIIGGNTNAPAIMIAEKAADLIRGRTPLPAASL